jgi:hypothetical protein
LNRGLAHGRSTLVNAHAALAQVGLPALNARNELRTKVGLVFELIGEPILKLQCLLGRKLAHLSFNGFKLARADSVPPDGRAGKTAIRP